MNNRVFDEYNYQDMDMINEMILSNNSNSNKLDGSYQGYIKGNMFNDLYDGYKNYKPDKLIPANEQEELLLNVNQTCFAAHDLRLYLDINPEDGKMIELFNNYQKQANNAIREYEEKYGLILSSSLSSIDSFNWSIDTWPWERKEY